MMKSSEDVSVEVEPFYLDLTPKELALLVQRRIDSTQELAKGLNGPDRQVADAELGRLAAWLATITTETDEEITIAVVESIALDELAEEERARRPAPQRRGAMPVC